MAEKKIVVRESIALEPRYCPCGMQMEPRLENISGEFLALDHEAWFVVFQCSLQTFHDYAKASHA